MKSIIVAYDQNRGIGANNDLLWHRDLPADLRHFKNLTVGHSVIMGFKTYQSIGRPLPERQNIVISHKDTVINGVEVVSNLDEAYAVAQNEEVFIIGGGQTYALAIDSVDQIFATEVGASFKADVFFPDINIDEWQEMSRESHLADEANKYPYDFVLYRRITPRSAL